MLTVQNISKAFGKKEVLVDVTFTLNKGKVVVLMGANGSGKTTLFNIISGFLNQDSGQILLNGKTTKQIMPHQLNRLGVSRTFQDLRLVGELTVLENVLLSFSGQVGEKWWKVLLPNKKVKEEQLQNEKKAKDILKKCFIDDIEQSKAKEISFGQQKLLNIACCIANDRDVVLLDEPAAGVNLIYRNKLVEITKVLKNDNKAVLIIEHNTDFIEAVADEIFFLNDGVITKFDNYETLKNNEQVQEAYI